MAASLYPDVPMSAGVPPVLREIGAAEATAVLLVADAAILAETIAGFFLAPQWGLFGPDGQPVAVADSVKAFDYRHEYDISSYLIEQGAFGSYNKVQHPFDCRLEFTIGDSSFPNLPGSQVARRNAFLLALEAACGSTGLFSAVTPEYTYPSVNPVHMDYRRSAQNGVALLTVAVWCQEVRVVGSAQFAQSNAQQPGGQADVNAGQVQTSTVEQVTQEPLAAPSAGPATVTLPAGSTDAQYITAAQEKFLGGPVNPTLTLPQPY